MSRLVGRKPELRQLLAALERVRSGTCEIATVEGEPGIGKTKLLAELLARATADGWHVLQCDFAELDVDRPFLAVASALHELCEQLATSVPAELVEASSLLDAALRLQGGDDVHGDYISSLIVEGLHEVARSTPMLVMFDDAHLIDDASARLLWGIARHRRTGPVFVVAALRPSNRETVTALRRSLDSRGAITMVLRSLDVSESDLLAMQILGCEPDLVVRRLLAEAGGNPLFITELLRGHSELPMPTDAVAGEDAHVPSTLRGLVFRRLASLPESTREALGDAALLGLSFDVRELAAVIGVDAHEALDHLMAAIHQRILIEDGTRLVFQHAIVQTIVASQRPEVARRARHRHIAQSLARLGAPNAQVAEHHWRSSPMHHRDASMWLRRAAQDVRPLSVEAALTWSQRALACLGDDEPTFDLQLDVAGLLILLGRVLEAEAICRSEETRTASTEQEIRLHTSLCALTMMAGRTRQAEAVVEVERVLALLGSRDPRRVEMLGWQALLSLFSGRLDDAERYAHQALSLEVDGDPGPMLSPPYDALGLVALLRGDVTLAQEFTAMGTAVFRDHGSTFSSVMMPHFSQAMALLSARPIGEVIDVLEDGYRACDRTGHALAHLHLEPLMGIAHFVRGDIAVARTSVERTIDRNEEWKTGGVALPTATGLAAYLAMLRDDLVTARVLADRALEELLSGGAQAGSADFAVWCVACVYEAGGERAQARDMLVGIWELLAKTASLYSIAPDLVRLTCDDRPEFAAEVVALAAARAERSGAALDRAHALASRGLLERNAALLDGAALAWEELGWSLTATRIRGFALEIVRRNGNRNEVRIRLGALLRAWDLMEVTYPIRMLTSAPENKGYRAVRAARPSHGPDSLSQAERSVVRLVGEGLTNKEIARRLFVSHRTVDTHVSHAFAKLGVSSRVQLAGLVVRERV